MPAGFLFSINGGKTANPLDTITPCVHDGIFSVLVNENWTSPVASTLGDHVCMQPGDNVYFFGKRTIYGIGEIIDALEEGDGAFEVAQGSSSPRYEPQANGPQAEENDEGRIKRWALAFKPSPFFFTDGIDMDDLLLSNPAAFRSLRTFHQRSFIQFDDEENRAFRAAFLRKFEHVLSDADLQSDTTIPCGYENTIDRIRNNKMPGIEASPIDLANLFLHYRTGEGLRNEMAVEIGLLHALRHGEPSAVETFGSWDYLAHQVHASPFKPIEYMDKIDVFGYRWIRGCEEKVISKYLIVEIKCGAAQLADTSPVKDYDQLMKYVDWVCTQYAHGDYSMIEAYLLAQSFDFSSCKLMKEATKRSYVNGHEAKTQYWDNFNCATYRATPEGTLMFERI